jgi:putative membrane protein
VLIREDAVHFVHGLLMGSADVIPGVSGGTVALIVGIYNRLVTAISHFDLVALDLVRRGKIGEAVAHIDLRFLIALGLGIATAILSLSSLIMMLLVEHRQHTYAAFFGMILGSSLLVARLVPRWNATRIVALLAAAIAAFVFVGLPQLQNPPQFSPVYLFFCGFFAICAMILPGVSGSFLLLILGAYTQALELLHRLKGMLQGEMISANDFFCLATFCLGMASGLIGFCRILRWLLARHESVTLAALTGFMLGSLRRLWPYQLDLTPAAAFDNKEFRALWPDFADNSTWMSLLLVVGGFVLVISLEAVAAKRMKTAEAEFDREQTAVERTSA